MEIGKWYKCYGWDKWLMYLTTIENDKAIGYGFNGYGDWFIMTSGQMHKDEKNHYLATKEEVESALRKEAERRGLTEYAKIICHADKGEWRGLGLNNQNFVNNYNFLENKLYNHNGVIFSNGQWAEIIEHSIEHLKSKIDYCGDVVSEHIPKDKPTITILDSDRKELGKIYRTNNK